jgi:hypothetical protein
MPTRLLDQVAKPIAVGVGSYRVFLLSWLALAVGLVGVMAETEGPLPSIATILKSAATLVGQVVALQYGALGETFCTLLVSRWRWTMLGSLVGFVAAWMFSNMADSRMSAVFSGFWHQHQEDLRTALKRARIEATAAKEGLR